MNYEIDKLIEMRNKIDKLSIKQTQELYQKIHGEIKELEQVIIDIDIKIDRYFVMLAEEDYLINIGIINESE